MAKAEKRGYRKFDPATYIDTAEDAAHYLAAAAEGGDAAHFAKALGDVARSRSMAQIADKTGMTREGLYKALSGSGNPSLATAMRVMTALGLKLDVKTAAKKKAPKKAA